MSSPPRRADAFAQLKPSHHRQKLQFYARAFGQCLEDLDAGVQGRDVLYLLDFSLLYPQCWDTHPSGTKAPLVSTVEVVRQIFAKAREHAGFQLVVSGPTMLEFQDMLAHQAEDLEIRFPRFPTLSELHRESVFDSTWTAGEKLEKLHKDLDILTETGRDERVRRPIRRLLALYDRGVLAPAGERVDMELVSVATDRDLYHKFVDQHRSARLPTERRALDDAMFHYKLDAANSALTRAAQADGDRHMLFVSPTPTNIEQCVDESRALGRSELTPLWLLNGEEQSQLDMIGNPRAYFQRGMLEGTMLASEIPGDNSDARLPAELLWRIMNYYGGTVGVVTYGSDAERRQRAFPEEDVEDIQATLSNPTRMKDVQESMIEDIRRGARQVEDRVPTGEIAYLAEFDFADDPTLKRARKLLGLSPFP